MVEERYHPPKGHPLLEGEPSKWGQPDLSRAGLTGATPSIAQVAVVEVDVDTGETRVLTIVSANDVGKVKRPQAIEGQIEGGVMQGVGFALSRGIRCGRRP